MAHVDAYVRSNTMSAAYLEEESWRFWSSLLNFLHESPAIPEGPSFLHLQPHSKGEAPLNLGAAENMADVLLS